MFVVDCFIIEKKDDGFEQGEIDKFLEADLKFDFNPCYIENIFE